MLIFDGSDKVIELAETQLEKGKEISGDEVTILHLSDLHYDESIVDNGRVFRELEENITRKLESLRWGILHQIVFSGDFVFGLSIFNECERELKKTTSDSQWKSVQKALKDGVEEGKNNKADAFLKCMSDKYVTAFKSCAEQIIKMAKKITPVNFREDRSILVVPGNHDLMRFSPNGPGRHPATHPRIKHYAENFANKFLEGRPKTDHLDKLTKSPTLTIDSRENGVIAIVGLDSNHFEYHQPDNPDSPGFGLINRTQLDQTIALFDWLSRKVDDRPLYTIVVFHYHLLPVEGGNITHRYSDGKSQTFLVDTQWVIERLQDHRVSMVLHGHRHLEALQQVSYHPLNRSVNYRSPSHILSCPPALPTSADGALLQVNLLDGEVHLEFLNPTQTQSDRFHPKTVPLISASRISPGEIRLYREMMAWLDGDALPSQRPANLLQKLDQDGDRAKIEKYKDLLKASWNRFGYVQCCGLPAGFSDPESDMGVFEDDLKPCDLPYEFPLSSQRCDGPVSNYSLLLLLRYRQVPDGFRYEILLSNHTPLRISDFSAWNSLLMPAFKPKEIREFLYRIKMDLVAANDPWNLSSQDRYPDKRALREKVDKKLSTLDTDALQSIAEQQRHIAIKEFVRFSPTDGLPRKYEYHLTSIDWFSARAHHEESFADLLNSLPSTGNTEQLNRGALRWESMKSREISPQPRGVAWFPLEEWRKCPAIVTRNADVMCWVEDCVEKMRNPGTSPGSDGYYRPSICVDKLDLGRESLLSLRIREIFPFTGKGTDEREHDEENSVQGLKERLRLVKYFQDYDLRNESPYESSDIRPAYLKRDGTFIRVYADLECSVELGLLRPVQRYTLTHGLERASKLYKAFDEIGRDMCNLEGYVLLDVASLEKPLSFLPPVIESVKTGAELAEAGNGEEGAMLEFLVCDGNHRIVELCWNQNKVYRVVLINGPAEPYYAHPFAADEWHVTAGQALPFPPTTPICKYLRREYTETVRNLAGAVVPKDERYRRYFRDFSTAFGFIGGQGGKPF